MTCFIAAGPVYRQLYRSTGLSLTFLVCRSVAALALPVHWRTLAWVPDVSFERSSERDMTPCLLAARTCG
jgi:hypothetical protein